MTAACRSAAAALARFARSGRAGRSGVLLLVVGGWSATWASGLALLPADAVWVSAPLFFLGLALIPVHLRRSGALAAPSRLGGLAAIRPKPAEANRRSVEIAPRG